MDQGLKKKLIIAASVGVAIIAGVFLKNKIQDSKFKPISRQVVLQILKKTRKENFGLFKQVAAMASNIAAQMKISQIDPQMVKGYLQAPESPLKIEETLQNNYTQVCQSFKVAYSQFNESVEFYIKNGDAEIKNFVKQCEQDYETSLTGKLPEVKVIVPASLTKQRLLQVQKKLSLKRYLLQIDMFRKVRGKSQQDLMSDPELIKSLSNPQVEQQKILQEEGLGQNDQPAAAVYASAVAKLRNDANFRQQLTKIENHYAKIFNKYKVKIQQNKVTENELNELEDELIYSQA